MTLDTTIDEGELGHILHHETLAGRFNNGEDILSDVFANRPDATTVEAGTLFWATDTNVLYRSDGATWSALAAGVTDHGALTGLADDDHPQYATNADLTTHEGAADPHTGYRLESADHTHQSTGLQAGQLDHGLALTGLTDDDHTQYLKEEASGGVASEVPDHTHASGAEAGTFDAANLTSGASADGTVLTSDGAGGAAWEAPAGGGATFVYATADVSRTSTTRTDDPDLQFTLAANGVYAFEAVLVATTATSTEHMSHEWVEPDGSWDFLAAFARHDATWGATAIEGGGYTESTGGKTITIGNGSSGGTAIAVIHGKIVAGASGGTFKLQWGTLNANSVTREKGSWLSYKKLN
jgi:hypothetical protein